MTHEAAHVGIVAFFMLFGIYFIVKARAFATPWRFFPGRARPRPIDDRVEAVLEYRARIEGTPVLPWQLAGTATLALGVAVAANLLKPGLAYALMCCVISVGLAVSYARMRNTGRTRAAILAPRSYDDVLPRGWYAVAALTAVLPLVDTATPALRLSALVTTVAMLTILSTSALIAKMAAILSGDDPSIEMYVERRLRTARLSQALMFLLFGVFAFLWYSLPQTTTPIETYAAFASLALAAAFAAWYIVRMFRPPESSVG